MPIAKGNATIRTLQRPTARGPWQCLRRPPRPRQPRRRPRTGGLSFDLASRHRRRVKRTGSRTPAQPDGLRRHVTLYDVVMFQAEFGVEALGRCRLFTGLGEGPLQSLARSLRLRRFKRGEVIFHQGDPGDALFIVASGVVKVVVPSEDGEEAILATLRRGDFLGERALIDGAPRSASAIALEATEMLTLPREQLRALVAGEPAIREALLIALAGEVRRLTTYVAELHFLDLTGRLAARLLRIPARRGERAATWS